MGKPSRERRLVAKRTTSDRSSACWGGASPVPGSAEGNSGYEPAVTKSSFWTRFTPSTELAICVAKRRLSRVRACPRK
jgi:hypothetical protein